MMASSVPGFKTLQMSALMADAYADIGNIIDNSNSDSEDDFDDF